MESALHEDAGAAQRQCFVDLSVDGLERLHVSLGRGYRAVESAKRAVFRAHIRVVDVSVDLISDDVPRVEPLAKGVGLHTKADQVIGPQHVESLGVGQAHVDSPIPSL